jgi:SAM-dependent methyltransferase
MKLSDVGNLDASGRLTTKTYWDHTWGRPTDVRKRARRIRRLAAFDHQLAGLLVDAVSRARSTVDRPRILEVGCANSIWLPYLAREANADVVGVDFSERGCDLARLNLTAMGVEGTIVCDDFFDYVKQQTSAFDVVLSFGVIEHFPDVANILSTLASVLRPGGVLLATIPNLAGVYGPIQRVIDEEVWRKHVVLTVEELHECGRLAGLDGLASGHVGGLMRLSSLNFSHAPWLPASFARVLVRALFEVDYTVFAARSLFRRTSSHPATAPYAYLRGTAGNNVAAASV